MICIRPLCLTLMFVVFISAPFKVSQINGLVRSSVPQDQIACVVSGKTSSRGMPTLRPQSNQKRTGSNSATTNSPQLFPPSNNTSSTPSGFLGQQQKRGLVHETDDTGLGAQSFALVIGVSKYEKLPQNAQLQFADADAKAVRDFLVGPKGGFKPDNVALLVNEEATWEKILRALERLQNQTGPAGLAFIFFAGHGIVNQSNQGFLVAYDSQPDDLLVSSIEMDRFNSALKNVRARSTVILSDACHSGKIGGTLGRNDSSEPLTNLTARAFAEPSGRMDQSAFIFSAASPTQSSIETESLKHGIFTYYVLEGLNGKADRNGDNLVNAKELYDYVSLQVQEAAKQRGYDQVPEYNPFYDRSIPLAYMNEDGMKLYREWFDSDPIISRTVALFDEALKENHLGAALIERRFRVI